MVEPAAYYCEKCRAWYVPRPTPRVRDVWPTWTRRERLRFLRASALGFLAGISGFGFFFMKRWTRQARAARCASRHAGETKLVPEVAA